MSNATLTISEPGKAAREISITTGRTTSIGRATDNVVCLESDPNISRYHAVIEGRGNSFLLSDLGSSNGTSVNGRPAAYQHKLQEGDLVVLGDSSTIEFRFSSAGGEGQSENGSVQSGAGPASPMETSNATAWVATPAPPSISASRPSLPLVIVGIVGGLMLVAIVTVALVVSFSGGCEGTVRIINPQSGSTIRGPLSIRVDAEETKCIERVTYQLDGTEVARAEVPPYNVTINAGELSALGGGNHILTVMVEDTKGKKKLQPDEVLVALEGGGTSPTLEATPTGQDVSVQENIVRDAPQDQAGIDVQVMSLRLASQISRKSGYEFDPEFTELIRRRTDEYRLSGYTDRARVHRRDINKAFSDRGLEPLLGYVMGMSRSRFNIATSSGGAGLWQVPSSIGQGYLSSGETAATALADPKRSPDVVAMYMKDLLNVFEVEDFMYAVACFGMPVSQAGEVRAKLLQAAPDAASRRNFWKMVKAGVINSEQAEQVVRFYAAGIVAENPKTFGLHNDQPFSSLY